jgi:hypothetical protein
MRSVRSTTLGKAPVVSTLTWRAGRRKLLAISMCGAATTLLCACGGARRVTVTETTPAVTRTQTITAPTKVRTKTVTAAQASATSTITVTTTAAATTATSRAPSGWPDQVRASFLNYCTVTRGGTAALCGCIADELARQVPTDQVKRLSADDPRVLHALAKC